MAWTLNRWVGFGTGGLQEVDGTVNTPTVVSSSGPSGYELVLNSASEAVYINCFDYISDAGDKQVIGFRYKSGQTDASGSYEILNGFETGKCIILKEKRASSTTYTIDLIDVSSGFPVVGTGTTTLNNGTEYFIELYWEHANSGVAELFIDGTQEYSVSAKDFNAGGTFESYRLIANSANSDARIQSVYIASGATASTELYSQTGAAPYFEIFYKQTANATGTPDAGLLANAATALTSGVGTDLADTPGNDSNLVTMDGSSDYATFDMPAFGAEIDGDSSIVGIGGIWRAEYTGGGSASHFIGLGDSGDGNGAASQGVTLTTTPAEYYLYRTTDLPTKAQQVRQGMANTGGRNIDWYEMWAIVAHVPGGGITVSPTGVSSTASVGSVTALFDWAESVTGVSSTASAGTAIAATDWVQPVTGVSATASVGSVLIGLGQTAQVTGVSAAAQVGTVTTAFDWAEAVTGVSATGSVGSVTVLFDWTESVTGVSTTASVGTVIAATDWVESVTGVGATASVGAVTAATDWVEPVTGVSATGSVGSVSVLFDWTEVVTGVSAASAVGAVTISTAGGVIVEPTGVSATASVGSVTVNNDWVQSVTGLASTASAGSVAIATDWVQPVTGVSATASVGAVTAVGSAIVSAAGVSAAASVGTVTLIYDWVETVTGVPSTASVGSVTVSAGGSIAVVPTGVSATASVGSVTVANDWVEAATGVSASASAGSVTTLFDWTELAAGVSAAGSVGSVTVAADWVQSVTGASATASVGSVVISLGGSVVAFPTGVSAASEVGAVTTSIGYVQLVNGLQVTAQIGSGVTIPGIWSPIADGPTALWTDIPGDSGNIWSSVGN